MAEWYSVETEEDQGRLVAAWPDAPIENLETLGYMLGTAQEQVIACAPAPAEGDDWDAAPRDSFVLAQLQVTKKVWNADNAANGTGGDSIGAEGYTFTPYQRDRLIRDIIRPRDFKPDVY